jgi:sugar/nucleoside kinase (ribokinase family)
MTPKYDIFCYGEIGIDNIIQVPHLPRPELAAFPTGDSYHLGGAAANSAACLGNWGVAVGLSGNKYGQDPYGRMLRTQLDDKAGLDLRYVEQAEDVVTPFTRALVTPDGDRSFLIYGYPQAPKVPLTAEMLAGAQFLALDLYGGPERLAAAQTAHAAGVINVISDIIDPEHPALPITGIANISAAFIRDRFPGVGVLDHVRRLQQISKGIIVLTDGAEPVVVLDRNGDQFSIQPPQVPAVDATGAGDAFRSGLLAGLVRGHDLRTSTRLGVAAGAFKVRHLGAATVLADWDEVEALAGRGK